MREFKEAVNTADVKADEKNNDEKINAGRRWQVAGRKYTACGLVRRGCPPKRRSVREISSRTILV